MRSAATRREPEPPPDAAAIIAGLGRVIAGSGEVHARLRRHERRIASVIARMEGDADLAALAGDLRTVLATVTVELISDAAHCAELREQAEALAPLVAFREMMTATLIAEGRRLEAAERDEAERARPVRHRHRKPHLTMVTGAAAAAVVAASAGTVYVAHDSAAVHPWAASRPAAARFEAGFPGSAVPVPSWSPSAKPSAAVASAHPAVTASPPPPSPSPSVPVPSSSPTPTPAQTVPSPSLLVSVRDLDLSGPTGTFTITATGGTVDWWVSTDIPGASVDVRQGVLSPGQEPVTITVTDPPGGEAGYVYVKWDGGGIASVWVTPSDGAPAVALP